MRWIASARWASRRARLSLPRWVRNAPRFSRAHQPGQAVVEAALTSAMVISTLIITLQISLVAAQMFSAMYVAQTTARWLAVHIDTIDTDLTAKGVLFATSLPGLSSGGLVSTTAVPGCSALVPTVGGKCTLRDSGTAITVTVRTSLTPVLFLPSTIGVAPYIIRFPAALPDVAYTVLLE